MCGENQSTLILVTLEPFPCMDLTYDCSRKIYNDDVKGNCTKTYAWCCWKDLQRSLAGRGSHQSIEARCGLRDSLKLIHSLEKPCCWQLHQLRFHPDEPVQQLLNLFEIYIEWNRKAKKRKIHHLNASQLQLCKLWHRPIQKCERSCRVEQLQPFHVD